MTPGLHDAIPAGRYHADEFGEQPSLTAGIACTLLNASPLHAWTQHPRLNPHWEPREEQKFDLGRVAHQVLLEGNSVVSIVPADDWRTASAKDARDWAREHELTPLLEKDWLRVQAMVEAAREQLEAWPDGPVPFTDGKPEQTLIWATNGVHCRARIDWLRDDLTYIDDYKTTSASANPERWTRTTLYSIGADIQVAFYLHGMDVVTGRDKRPEWRYVVQETFPPYALSVISLAPSVIELANDKIAHAIAVWRNCLERDEWPAYPHRVCWAELPPWQETAWLEREAREELAA